MKLKYLPSYPNTSIQEINILTHNSTNYVDNIFMHNQYVIIFDIMDNVYCRYISTRCTRLVYDSKILDKYGTNFSTNKCLLANLISVQEIICIGNTNDKSAQIIIDDKNNAYRNFEIIDDVVVIDSPFTLSAVRTTKEKVSTNVLPFSVKQYLHLDHINSNPNIFDMQSSITRNINHCNIDILRRYESVCISKELMIDEIKKAVNKILLYDNSIEFVNNAAFNSLVHSIIINYHTITLSCLSVDMESFKLLCRRYISMTNLYSKQNTYCTSFRCARFSCTSFRCATSCCTGIVESYDIVDKSFSSTVIFNAKLFFNITINLTRKSSGILTYMINKRNVIINKLTDVNYKNKK
jgi:hypothetical protein